MALRVGGMSEICMKGAGKGLPDEIFVLPKIVFFTVKNPSYRLSSYQWPGAKADF